MKHYAIQVSIQHFQVYDFALQFLRMLVSELRLNTHETKHIQEYKTLYLLPNSELDACI
jgi:hypothetical protein